MARSFNGTSDFIDLGTSSTLGVTTSLTIAAWINGNGSAFPGPSQTQGWILTKDDNTLGRDYDFGVNNSGVLTLQLGGTNNLGSATVSTNGWQHVAAVYDSSGVLVKTYINGSLDLSQSASGTAGTNTSNAQIGHRTFSGFPGWFQGYMADVAFWNTNLSAGNITSLFNGVRPVNVNSANLIGWWPLDGYASPETDLSSNANNGTLTGTARVLGPPPLWRVSAGS